MREHHEKIAYEGALLRAVARQRADLASAKMLARIATETGQPITTARPTAAGDPQRLRGIPCVGRGIGGTAQLLDGLGGIRITVRTRRFVGRTMTRAELTAYRAWLEVNDGTSPGTAPDQAALDH